MPTLPPLEEPELTTLLWLCGAFGVGQCTCPGNGVSFVTVRKFHPAGGYKTESQIFSLNVRATTVLNLITTGYLELVAVAPEQLQPRLSTAACTWMADTGSHLPDPFAREVIAWRREVSERQARVQTTIVQ